MVSGQLHQKKQKLVTAESLNEVLQGKLHEEGVLVQKLNQNNEKLHRDLEHVISKANHMEIQLDRKRDEISQLKNDNEFLIKQVILSLNSCLFKKSGVQITIK